MKPYFFNVCVSEMVFVLGKSGVGCHIAGQAAISISYADVPALVAPTALVVNQLILICESFSMVDYAEYSISQTVCMCLLPQRLGTVNLPNVTLAGNNLEYVENFKHLGHLLFLLCEVS